MNGRTVGVAMLLLWSSTYALIAARQAQRPASAFRPVIPATWDEQAIASVVLPLASTGVPPEHISPDYYYRMPVRPIYKSYPIYAPTRSHPDTSTSSGSVSLRSPSIRRRSRQKPTARIWPAASGRRPGGADRVSQDFVNAITAPRVSRCQDDARGTRRFNSSTQLKMT